MAEDYSLKKIFGGKDTAEYANYKAGQKSGQWSDYNSYLAAGGNNKQTPGQAQDANIQKMVSANMSAVQPAIKSYQDQIPETQAAYAQRREQLEAEKTPLQERFANLLNRVKGTFEGQKTMATTTTNNELGRRGIVSSSGIADREMQGALNPIMEREGQAYTDIGLEQESAMRNLENMMNNLTTEEQSSIRQILNSIGGLSAQAGMGGVSQGLQLQGMNMSAAQSAAAQELQRKNMQTQIDQFAQQFGMSQQEAARQAQQWDKTFGLEQQKLALSQANANKVSPQDQLLQKALDLLNKQNTGSGNVYDLAPGGTGGAGQWVLRQ